MARGSRPRCCPSRLDTAVALAVTSTWVASTQLSRVTLDGMRSASAAQKAAPFFIMWFTTALNAVSYPCYLAARTALGRGARPPPLPIVPWGHLAKLASVLYFSWAAANYLYTLALTRALPSEVTAASGATPAFVYVLSCCVLPPVHAETFKVAAVVISFAGVALIALAGAGAGAGAAGGADGAASTTTTTTRDTAVGAALALASSACAALYKVYFKRGFPIPPTDPHDGDFWEATEATLELVRRPSWGPSPRSAPGTPSKPFDYRFKFRLGRPTPARPSDMASKPYAFAPVPTAGSPGGGDAAANGDGTPGANGDRRPAAGAAADAATTPVQLPPTPSQRAAASRRRAGAQFQLVAAYLTLIGLVDLVVGGAIVGVLSATGAETPLAAAGPSAAPGAGAGFPWLPLAAHGAATLLFNLAVNAGLALTHPLPVSVGMALGVPASAAVDVWLRPEDATFGAGEAAGGVLVVLAFVLMATPRTPHTCGCTSEEVQDELAECGVGCGRACAAGWAAVRAAAGIGNRDTGGAGHERRKRASETILSDFVDTSFDVSDASASDDERLDIDDEWGGIGSQLHGGW